LIDYLKERRAERLLEQLAFFRKAHKTDRDYQLREESSHPELIQNEPMLRQKLEYKPLAPTRRVTAIKLSHSW